MAELYFTVGLTDNVDYDGFVHQSAERTPAGHVTYNIQRASTDIEKDSIRWKLNINIPATLNIIAMWEAIIRRPHLNMINIQKIPTELLKDYNSYVLNIDYINLIPINPAFAQELQPMDYDAMTEDLEFGDLYLNEFSMYPHTDWSRSLSSAYHTSDLSKLQAREDAPTVATKFSANFQLRNYSTTPRLGPSSIFTSWAENNREELTAKGYIPGSTTCRIGSLCIGKLVGDPWDEYQKLQTYPAICRTSITKVE